MEEEDVVVLFFTKYCDKGVTVGKNRDIESPEGLIFVNIYTNTKECSFTHLGQFTQTPKRVVSHI